MDEGSARDITDRAGHTSVVTVTRGGLLGNSENLQQHETLTAADLQQLGAGESVVIRQGLPPVIMYTPSVYDNRRLTPDDQRETAEVTA